MLICPSCNASRLVVSLGIELGPDGYSDEISLQIIECAACGLRSAALYEESRRGASERVHHFTLPLAAASVRELEQRIRACPDPRNPRCTCRAHAALGRHDELGSWTLSANGLSCVGARRNLHIARDAPASVPLNVVAPPQGPGRPRAPRWLLLLGLALLWGCAWLMIHQHSRHAWFGLFIAPLLTPSILWLVVFGEREWNVAPSWWKHGARVCFVLGLLASLWLLVGGHGLLFGAESAAGG